MAGCDTCEQNLMAEMESAEDEELGEQAKKVMQGEAEAPWAYGPLSSWDGPYCEFCHRVGHVLAVVIGGMMYWLVTSVYGVPATQAIPGVAVLFYAPLALTVLYIGRFPLLGAVFGPMAERVFAEFGYYPTESAKQKYKNVLADGGMSPNPRKDGRTFRQRGTEVHLVATQPGLDNCMSVYENGAIERIVVKNGQIIDRLNAHPNMEFNRFPNLQDHVGISQGVENICQSHKEVMTTVDLQEMVEKPGQGIETGGREQ